MATAGNGHRRHVVVVGGGFAGVGAVNPALTAMANALRVGDHLLERLA